MKKGEVSPRFRSGWSSGRPGKQTVECALRCIALECSASMQPSCRSIDGLHATVEDAVGDLGYEGGLEQARLLLAIFCCAECMQFASGTPVASVSAPCIHETCAGSGCETQP